MQIGLTRRHVGIVRGILFGLAVLLSGPAPQAAQAQDGAKQPRMTLQVGQISDSIAFFPIFVAKKQGFFAKHDLRIGDIPLLGTGAKLAAALQSGSIDVAGGNGTDPLNLYRANKGTRMIAQLVNTYYVDIITGPSFSSPQASAPLAERIQALKGKKIGVTGPGSGTQALVDFLLGTQGMHSSTDITLVSLGSNMTGALGALKTGRVDALSFPQPVGQQAEATHIGSIYISPARGDIPQLKHVVHGVVFTTQSILDHKGPEVTAFVRGIADAERFIHSADASSVRTLFKAYRPTMSDATVDRLLAILRSEIPATPDIGQAEFDGEVQFNLKSGLIKEAPDYATMVPATWLKAALGGH
ncbi:MAG TPA: ABC transporter substrate-binding protein [Castellaniella sp.]|jgi:ABC-type nitrate/sulfonate/bicarbonate transport system substrate-binding protein|nr:ABC transporter substrate-binding protein [Castellaniella sp.]